MPSNVGDSEATPSSFITTANVSVYVISGCTQPLLMTLLKNAGVANSSCQLYMLFYYLGPASIIFSLHKKGEEWPAKETLLKATGIALFDIVAASMNYTGAALAGPTIFAIVYSSVTIWAAIFSQIFLARSMNFYQWLCVFVVFLGLTMTTTHSRHLGHDVVNGLIFIILGSMMHALTYVMCEGIMTVGEHRLSVRQNCAVQGMVAMLAFLLWQFVYTLPRWDEKIWQPMQKANTSIFYAVSMLIVFGLSNLFHSITFFHTLRHYPGGATSAGVMKGLQAVLVFVLTHLAYCGRTGGEEMCFTFGKFLSLVTVTSGVIGYGIATSKHEELIATEERDDESYSHELDPLT